MSNLKIKLNIAGVTELRHEVGQTLCVQEAQRIASEAGADNDMKRMGTRTIASVFTSDEGVADEILRHI